MSEPEQTGTERFEESTNLQYGVVEEVIGEDDVLPFNGTRAIVWDFDSSYVFGTSTRVGMDFSIYFDELDYHDGTLWFYRTAEDGREQSGAIEWSVADAGHYYGLVGEWFREQLDLTEYRTEADCPKCGGTVLSFTETSCCDRLDCDFFTEGVVRDV